MQRKYINLDVDQIPSVYYKNFFCSSLNEHFFFISPKTGFHLPGNNTQNPDKKFHQMI